MLIAVLDKIPYSVFHKIVSIFIFSINMLNNNNPGSKLIND